MDTALDEHAYVWAGGGQVHSMVRTSFKELVAMTGGEAADVGATRPGLDARRTTPGAATPSLPLRIPVRASDFRRVGAGLSRERCRGA